MVRSVAVCMTPAVTVVAAVRLLVSTPATMQQRLPPQVKKQMLVLMQMQAQRPMQMQRQQELLQLAPAHAWMPVYRPSQSCTLFAAPAALLAGAACSAATAQMALRPPAVATTTCFALVVLIAIGARAPTRLPTRRSTVTGLPADAARSSHLAAPALTPVSRPALAFWGEPPLLPPERRSSFAAPSRSARNFRPSVRAITATLLHASSIWHGGLGRAAGPGPEEQLDAAPWYSL